MDCNKNCNKGSLCACLIVSLIVGIIVGVLFFFGMIPEIMTAAWIVFGLAVLNLIFLVFGAFSASVQERSGLSRCLCKQGLCYLISIVVALVLSIVVLSLTLSAASIFHVVLVGIVAFSASLMLCQLISLVKCVIFRLCRRYSEKSEICD